MPFCSNTSILHTTDALKALLSKMIFSSSVKQKFNHLLGCHAIKIISLFNSLFALRFSNLICQTKIPKNINLD